MELRNRVCEKLNYDFLIDDVWGLGGEGIRMGLDIGVGSSYTEHLVQEWLREIRNIAVVTDTMNVHDAPFSEFVAARGLLPLFLSLDHRSPLVQYCVHIDSHVKGIGCRGTIGEVGVLDV